MFKDVQTLKIKAAEELIAVLKNKERELREGVTTLKDQLWNYERDLEKLESSAKYSSGVFSGKKVSGLQRLFNAKAREKFRIYQKAVADLESLPQKIAIKKSEIEIAEQQVREKIASSGLEQEIEQAEHILTKINTACSLADLKITPAEAVKLLEDNNIQPIIDESDNVKLNNPRNYQSRSDLIAIHKMDIMPTGSRLVPVGEVGVKRTKKINLDGKDYEYSFALDRKTVHFSMNGEVLAHEAGDWQECHYTVMQPFDEIPIEKVGVMEPNDTYTRGSVDLTKNAWILCPANEIETVRDLNPHVHVVGYKNANANGLVEQFVSQLGYHAEGISSNGWSDVDFKTGQFAFQNIAKRENVNVIQHSNSTDSEDEDFQIATNKVIALVKLIMDNGLVQSPADFERLRPQLDAQADFTNDLHKITSQTAITDQSIIDNSAVVANGRNMQVLAEKMARAGIPMTAEEQAVLQARYENENYDEVYALNGNQTREEFLVKIMMNCAARVRSKENQNLMDVTLTPKQTVTQHGVEDEQMILW